MGGWACPPHEHPWISTKVASEQTPTALYIFSLCAALCCLKHAICRAVGRRTSAPSVIWSFVTNLLLLLLSLSLCFMRTHGWFWGACCIVSVGPNINSWHMLRNWSKNICICTFFFSSLDLIYSSVSVNTGVYSPNLSLLTVPPSVMATVWANKHTRGSAASQTAWCAIVCFGCSRVGESFLKSHTKVPSSMRSP